MIIWLNGGFAAGKTTLAEELRRRIDGAVVYDPEDVGQMLWRWVGPNNDFQDLAAWRELVVSTALALRRHHADTLVVPMSLIRPAYRDEILGGLTAAGESVLHVFLAADITVLSRRLRARGAPAENPAAIEAAQEWATRRNTMAVAVADQQPQGTLVLRSDELSIGQLADAVLTTARARMSACSGEAPG